MTPWGRVGPHETTWDHAGPHGTPGTDPFRVISTYGKFISTYGNFQRLVGPRGTSGTARVHPRPPASIRDGRVPSSPHVVCVMIEPRKNLSLAPLGWLDMEITVITPFFIT